MTHCRQPFAHDPETCTCEPEPASVAVRNAELNAAIRDWQDKTFGWKLLAVFLATGLISFSTLYAVAAVVEQGMENIEAHRVEGLPT